jgi:hypothetical protein
MDSYNHRSTIGSDGDVEEGAALGEGVSLEFDDDQDEGAYTLEDRGLSPEEVDTAAREEPTARVGMRRRCRND